MKKFITILSVTLAAVVYVNTATAQTGTSVKEAQKTSVSNSKTSTATDVKTATTPQQVRTSPNTATKTGTTVAAKNQSDLDAIKAYETKIEANRNNPKFDLKAAEAELARLKANAGVK